jgi:hypothetical protein
MFVKNVKRNGLSRQKAHFRLFIHGYYIKKRVKNKGFISPNFPLLFCASCTISGPYAAAARPGILWFFNI